MATKNYGTWLPTDYEKIASGDDKLDIAGYPKTRILKEVKPKARLNFDEYAPFGFKPELSYEDKISGLPEQNIHSYPTTSSLLPNAVASQADKPYNGNKLFEQANNPLASNLSDNIGTTYPQSTSQTPTAAVAGKKPSYKEFFKNLGSDKKEAISMALLAAGLNIMASAGRTSPTPISTMGLIGEGGMQGLNMYQNVDRYNKDMGMRDAYLGFAKQAADQSQATFGSKQPYLLEQAKRENEIQKAQLNNARNPEQKVINLGEYGTVMIDRFGNATTIATPNARGGISEKEYKNHVAKQKEIISWVVPNEADFFAKLFELKDPAQKEALIASNPSTIEKLKKELEKPENAKYKAQWLISEKYTDEYLYGQGGVVNAGSNLSQTTSERQPPIQKQIGNKNYILDNGKWYEQ